MLYNSSYTYKNNHDHSNTKGSYHKNKIRFFVSNEQLSHILAYLGSCAIIIYNIIAYYSKETISTCILLSIIFHTLSRTLCQTIKSIPLIYVKSNVMTYQVHGLFNNWVHTSPEIPLSNEVFSSIPAKTKHSVRRRIKMLNIISHVCRNVTWSPRTKLNNLGVRFSNCIRPLSLNLKTTVYSLHITHLNIDVFRGTRDGGRRLMLP